MSKQYTKEEIAAKLESLKSDVDRHIEEAIIQQQTELINRLIDVRTSISNAQEALPKPSIVKGAFIVIFSIGFSLWLLIILYQDFTLMNSIGYYNEDKTLIIQFIKTLWGKISVTIFIASTGCILFLFKKKQQFYYGIVETIFACLNCYIVADNFSQQINRGNYILFSGMTTIYLIVRGLSNIADGWRGAFFLKGKMNKESIEELLKRVSTVVTS